MAVHKPPGFITSDSCRYDHVTPLLNDLHWLHVPERITYKLCVLVYCLHGTAPRCHSAFYWSNVAPSTAVGIVIRSYGLQTDRWTHKRTDGWTTYRGITAPCVASWGKNVLLVGTPTHATTMTAANPPCSRVAACTSRTLARHTVNNLRDGRCLRSIAKF